MDTANVESLASSLVREYLSRKGCRNTLAELDKEFPRPKNSISNRLQLIHALSIEPWVKENRRNGSQYKTLIEIIASQTMTHVSGASHRTSLSSSRNDSFTERNINQHRSDHHFTQQSPLLKKKSSLTNPDNYYAIQNTQTKNVDDSCVTDSLDLSSTTYEKPDEPLRYKMRNSNFSTRSPVVANTSQEHLKSNLNIVPSTSNIKAVSVSERKQSELTLEDFIDGGNNKRNMFNKSKMMDSPLNERKPARLSHENTTNNANKTKKDEINFKAFLDFLEDEENTEEFQSKPKSTSKPLVSDNQRSEVSCSSTRQKASLLKLKGLVGEVTFDVETAMAVRQLIFGTDKRGFTAEWTDQGFTFNDCENGEPTFLRIGIVQKKGGPCGILGAVQALVLKNYLFSSDDKDTAGTLFDDVYSYQRSQALQKTIVETIWRCKVDDEKVYLAVLTMSKQFSPPPNYRSDGITEYVMLIPCSTHKELQTAVHEHLKEYEKGRGSCILLLYSLILTHGVNTIKNEMDEAGGRLMGLHGYCTQEMINLVLQGEAISNAFDNSIRLGEDTLLRGLSHQSDIGMLSLFEHYDSVKIGEFYKSPKYPIWLICSESHFTVLFSLDEKITSRQFDLFYYDGLANQDEVIKLTINKEKLCSESDLSGSLVPPINHCIRTKWPKVYINWNSTDPIL